MLHSSHISVSSRAPSSACRLDRQLPWVVSPCQQLGLSGPGRAEPPSWTAPQRRSIPAVACRVSSCCQSSCHLPSPPVSWHQDRRATSIHSLSQQPPHPALPQLPARPPACHSTQRKPANLASRASRLTPPNASLAFAEPATAFGSASCAAAGTATATTTAAAAAGSLSFPQFVAVFLGYCVMVGSLFRSVPQIIKVIKHNSTEGLSLMSYIVELCCYTVVIAYNLGQGYGFNTFGEVVACWIQDIILIALVFKDRQTPPWVILLSAAAFTAGCSFLLSPSCPNQLLSTMQASNIAIMALGSRLPQIVLNMRRGNAGMLSVTTCLLNVAGNAARIFTTIVLTGDLLMLGGACSQGCLNTILLCQSISTARARSAATAGGAAAAAAGSSSSAGSSTLQQPKQQQRQQADAPPGGPEGPSGGFPVLQPAT